MKRHWTLTILLALTALLTGCGRSPENSAPSGTANLPKADTGATKPPPTTVSTNPETQPDAKPVSDRPANPDGSVFVLEYHHLGTSKDSMFRSPDKFRGDLERLDKMGFRPETVTEYLEGSKDLPKGASPAVFTFDDSNPDQIKLNADGTLSDDCFLGIWQEFAKTHPEFPIRATFFVLPDTMWGQHKMLPAKLDILNRLGCELGNHTMTHPILRKLADKKAEWEIGEAQLRLEALGVKMPCSLALPFGVSPRNEQILKGFEYNGQNIAPKAVFLVGANPAPPAASSNFKKLHIPRIQAYDGPFGIKYWLDEVDAGKVKPYVGG